MLFDFKFEIEFYGCAGDSTETAGRRVVGLKASFVSDPCLILLENNTSDGPSRPDCTGLLLNRSTNGLEGEGCGFRPDMVKPSCGHIGADSIWKLGMDDLSEMGPEELVGTGDPETSEDEVVDVGY